MPLAGPSSHQESGTKRETPTEQAEARQGYLAVPWAPKPIYCAATVPSTVGHHGTQQLRVTTVSRDKGPHGAGTVCLDRKLYSEACWCPGLHAPTQAQVSADACWTPHATGTTQKGRNGYLRMAILEVPFDPE